MNFSEKARVLFAWFSKNPKGQVALATTSNALNALSKASFLAVASHLLDGGAFERFILLVVIIDASTIFLDLGGSAGLIISARDVQKQNLPDFYAKAQAFKFIYLVLLGLVLQFFWGTLAAVCMIAVCIFEFQNTELQSKYKFFSQFLRHLSACLIRFVALVSLWLTEAEPYLLLILFYLPQILIGIGTVVLNIRRSVIIKNIDKWTLKRLVTTNKEIYKIGRSSLFMQIVILALRRGDILLVAVFLDQKNAAILGLLLSFSSFLPMISSAFTKVFLPYVLDNKSLYDAIAANQKKIFIFSFAVSTLMATILGTVYSIIIPDEKLISTPIVWIILFAISVNMVFQPMATVLYRLRSLGALTKIHLEQLVFQATIAVLLISLYGLPGVALSFFAIRIYGLIRLGYLIRTLHGTGGR